MATTPPRRLPFRTRHRTAILALGVALFLPPLSALFQLTGDVDFCGRWCPRMFFVWRDGASLGTFVAGVGRSLFGALLVTAVLGTTLAFGRLWCSHLCPVGGLLELGSRLVPRRLTIDFSGLPAPTFRYAYLSVYLLAPALGVGSLCCSYCNFAAVPRLLGALFSRADLLYFLRIQGAANLVLVLGLGLLARGGRAYCNLLCPLGALDALVANVRARFTRGLRIDPHRCTGCGRCAEVCPTWAIATASAPCIGHLSCIPCGRCLEVCPTGAIDDSTAAS